MSFRVPLGLRRNSKLPSLLVSEVHEFAKRLRRDSPLLVYFQELRFWVGIAQPRKSISKNKRKEHNVKEWGVNQLPVIKAE